MSFRAQLKAVAPNLYRHHHLGTYLAVKMFGGRTKTQTLNTIDRKIANAEETRDFELHVGGELAEHGLSLMRAKSSGRMDCGAWVRTCRSIVANEECCKATISAEPIFEVKTTWKPPRSSVSPLAIVTRAASRICRNTSSTRGCAFSILSKSVAWRISHAASSSHPP